MKINDLELEKKIDENLKDIFSVFINNTSKDLKNKLYYHFLDASFYAFLEDFLVSVDSYYTDCLDYFEGNLNQYIYISYYGDTVDLDFLISLKTNNTFENNALEIIFLEGLVDGIKCRKKEIWEMEPILHRDITNVCVKSFLELLNNK